MRFFTTLFLLCAVALAGAALWVLEGRDFVDGRLKQAREQALRLRPDQVSSLLLELNGSRLAVQREDGGWQIVEPVAGRADAGAMDRLLTVLANLLRGEVITARDRRDAGLTLRDYGLEDPRGRIQWTSGDGKRVWWVGRDAPLGENVYIRQDGEEDVVAVSALLLSNWPTSVDGLRDRVLFHGEPRNVYRFEIRRPGGFLQVQRGDDGSWRIQQPLAAVADAVAVRQWLDQVFEWRIANFVADAVSDWTVYGLDESSTQITVWSEGQDAGQSISIRSPADQVGDWLYARRRDGTSVFTLPGASAAVARVRPNDLRDRQLVNARPRDIHWVQIQLDQETVILERDPANGWMITYPKRWRADDTRVEAMIEAWTSARIDQFVEEPATDSAHALPPLNIHFALQAPNLVTNLVGSSPSVFGETVLSVQSGVDERRLRVRRNQEPYSYEIGDAVRQVTSRDPLYYRDRVVMQFPASAILRIRQAIDEQELLLERDALGQWVVPGRGALDIDAALLQHALAVLSRLHADEYVVDNPADWSLYGMDPPAAVWSIGLSADAGIGRVLWLGDRLNDGRIYARTLGHDTVFLLDSTVATLLTRPLAKADDVLPDRAPDERGE